MCLQRQPVCQDLRQHLVIFTSCQDTKAELRIICVQRQSYDLRILQLAYHYCAPARGAAAKREREVLEDTKYGVGEVEYSTISHACRDAGVQHTSAPARSRSL